MRGKLYDKIHVWFYFSKGVFVCEKLVNALAELTVDIHPLHTNKELTSPTIFNKWIAYGGFNFTS